MMRFVSYYNLAIRYWDQGKSALAIREAENAVGMLSKRGNQDVLIGPYQIL
jgi:hypothetical protein